MKIALNMGNSTNYQSTKEAAAKAVERDVLMAQKSDWNARNSLIKTFMPLLTNLAEKRAGADEVAKNQLIEAGKDGLLKAANNYKKSIGADKFQIFALDFIEKAMDKSQKGGGFFARLFGKK